MTANKKSSKLKEPVRVRTKKLADGSESYYLDIYVNGKRSYEFLKMYHLPEVNARVREQNRATREAVEAIKSQRIMRLQTPKPESRANQRGRNSRWRTGWKNSMPFRSTKESSMSRNWEAS